MLLADKISKMAAKSTVPSWKSQLMHTCTFFFNFLKVMYQSLGALIRKISGLGTLCFHI